MGQINISTKNFSYFKKYKITISSSVFSRRKLLSKRKRSIMNNKILFYTRYILLKLNFCEIVKGSSHYHNYVAAGRSCDHKVTEKHFQLVNRKQKYIKKKKKKKKYS